MSALPRRRLVVHVHIGADSWQDVCRAMQQVADWADRKTDAPDGPQVIDMCAGGPSAGYTVVGSLDASVTHESYFAAVDEWKAKRNSVVVTCGARVTQLAGGAHTNCLREPGHEGAHLDGLALEPS